MIDLSGKKSRLAESTRGGQCYVRDSVLSLRDEIQTGATSAYHMFWENRESCVGRSVRHFIRHLFVRGPRGICTILKTVDFFGIISQAADVDYNFLFVTHHLL